MGNNKIKTVAISGAGGFIGSHLSGFFRGKGLEVIPLSRKHFTDEGAAELSDIITRSDVVVNLAGSPINHRWTEKYKKELFASRVNTTRRIVEVITATDEARRPKVFFSASAVGYYSDKGCNSEGENHKGSGFLSGLCEAWETEANKTGEYVRTVIMRFGLVLSPDGGVLKTIGLPTRFRFSAILGNGKQPFPWIDIEDLIGAIDFICGNEKLSGTYNFVAPRVITNSEFTGALAFSKRSWIKVNIPGFIFKAALGEASSFVLSGQCVIPERLLTAGYVFKSPDIETFFRKYR